MYSVEYTICAFNYIQIKPYWLYQCIYANNFLALLLPWSKQDFPIYVSNSSFWVSSNMHGNPIKFLGSCFCMHLSPKPSTRATKNQAHHLLELKGKYEIKLIPPLITLDCIIATFHHTAGSREIQIFGRDVNPSLPRFHAASSALCPCGWPCPVESNMTMGSMGLAYVPTFGWCWGKTK